MYYYDIDQLICMQNPAYPVECARFPAIRNENVRKSELEVKLKKWKISRNGIKLIVNACNLDADPIFGVIQNSKDQRVSFSLLLFSYSIFKKMIPQIRWGLRCGTACHLLANVLFACFLFAFDFVLENCMVPFDAKYYISPYFNLHFCPTFRGKNKFMHLMEEVLVLSPFNTDDMYCTWYTFVRCCACVQPFFDHWARLRFASHSLHGARIYSVLQLNRWTEPYIGHKCTPNGVLYICTRLLCMLKWHFCAW